MRVAQLLAAAGLSAAVSVLAEAQEPDATPIPRGTIVGRVVDTADVALADAQIMVLVAGKDSVVGGATSGPDGRFIVPDLPSGGPYDVHARKIGYGPGVWTDVLVPDADTLRAKFRLPPAPHVLPEIVADARKGSPRTWRNIKAGEFNPRRTPNALFVLGRHRPDMLGDPVRCPDPPPLPLWRQQEEQVAEQQGDPMAPMARTLGPAGKLRRPWLDSLYQIRRDPFSPYVLRVYVNGIRRDLEGKSPLATLREIPAKEIKEMYYADCHDQTVPIDMRYSVFVVLKPLSQAEQERYLKRALGTGPRPDSAPPLRDSPPPLRDSPPPPRDSPPPPRDSVPVANP